MLPAGASSSPCLTPAWPLPAPARPCLVKILPLPLTLIICLDHKHSPKGWLGLNFIVFTYDTHEFVCYIYKTNYRKYSIFTISIVTIYNNEQRMHVNFSMLQLTIDSFFTLLLQYYPFGIMRFIDKFQKDCLWSFIKKTHRVCRHKLFS